MTKILKIVIAYVFLLLRVGSKVHRMGDVSQLKAHFLLSRAANVCSPGVTDSAPRFPQSLSVWDQDLS